MAETYRPRDASETLRFVSWACAEEKPIEVVGTGSKRALGRPLQTELTLDMSALTGITLYEPEELVLTAQAGTPLAEIRAAVAGRDQDLAFEPMDYGPLLGRPAGEGTIGGLTAANLAGPRRISKGAARDHILGARAVSGRGEAFKSGGRVVKNVTGYDLPKVLAGSWGTLAVLTEVTYKILPRPETSLSLIIPGLSDARAADAMSMAMGSSAEVSGAAHLPAPAARAIGGPVAASGRAATVVRLEGIPVSVASRADSLAGLLKGFGPVERIAGVESEGLWAAIRDVKPFWPEAGNVGGVGPSRASDALSSAPSVWRLSVAPMSGPAVVEAIVAGIPGASAYYDWQGGLVWLAVPSDRPDAGAAVVRPAIARAGGGHATLIRAPAAIRASLPVFEPQPAPLATLSARLKAEFDPKGILNPGRMTA